jgi:hypothetical protein
LHAWMMIASERVATLTRSMQRTGSWDDFVRDLGPHVVGEKMGRAVVPYGADWSNGDTQPRAGAHRAPGARWTLLCLDVDESTDEEVEGAWSRLQESGIQYLIHSTHSFEPGKNMKVRIFVPLSEPIVESQVSDAKGRLGAWLGLKNDMSTKGGHTLYFTPRVDAWKLSPEDPEDAPFHVTGGYRPLLLSTLPALPKQEAGSPLRDMQRPRSVAPRTDWPEEVVKAAQESLAGTCRRIAQERSNHLRELIKSNVRWLGGFVGAGLLSWDPTLAALTAAVHERAAHNTVDDKDADERTQQVEDLLSNGTAAPCVPHGFSEEGTFEDPTKLYGWARLHYQLKAQVPDRLYSVEEAASEMAGFLRAPLAGHRSTVGLIEVSTGTGKTYALRQLAAERALRGQYTVILSLDHALLGQIRRDLESAGTPCRQLSGITQPDTKTGLPQCARAGDADVQMLVRSGANVAASACRKCPLRSSCPALKARRRALSEYVVLAPYDTAGRAIDLITERKDSLEPPLLVCDEEPPGAVRVTVGDEQLAALSDQCGVWPCLREDQAALLKGLVRALQDGEPGSLTEETLQMARGFYGQLHAPSLSYKEERDYRDELAVLRAVLQLAGGWGQLERRKGDWTTKVPGRVWDALRQLGGFVLTATPNARVYAEASLMVEQIKLRVQDAPGTRASRTILYTSHGSRRGVGANKGGELYWDIIEADLKQLFELADRTKPNATILIGTFMRIATALKTTHAHLLEGRDVDVTYYEVARGRDDWKGRDVFASMYDPRPGGQDTFEEMHEAASRALEQFHGRARDPQPRAVGAMHVHFGTLAPISWYDSGADVEAPHTLVASRPVGRPPARIPDDQIEKIERYIQVCAGGNPKQAAHQLGMSPKTLSQKRKGKSGFTLHQQEIIDEGLAR